MIASMTGFARRETTGEWGTLVCELRSVNHRFLEAGFRLPDELRAAEGELRARLTRQLRRGKVAGSFPPIAMERATAAIRSSPSRSRRTSSARAVASSAALGSPAPSAPAIASTVVR